jgi:3-oxoadipate enol-lactonase
MTQVTTKFHLSHGPRNQPALIFLPYALIPPNTCAPLTRIVKLRAIGVGWLEGAGPRDLHSVTQLSRPNFAHCRGADLTRWAPTARLRIVM